MSARIVRKDNASKPCSPSRWWRCYGTTSTSLSGGSASASSSVDNAKSQSATDATASRAGSSTSDTSARNASARNASARNTSARNTVAGDNIDDSNSHAQNDSHSMTPAGAFGHATAATRKRALIKAFRLEFARRIVVEKASQKHADAFGATRYLDQFSDELDAAEIGHIQIAKQCPILDQCRDPPHRGAVFPGCGWIIDQLLQVFCTHQLGHQFIVFTTFIIALSAILISGCATFERGVPQDVIILSFPTEASVYINGEATGITPMKIALPRKVTHEIRLEKYGYNPAVKYFAPVPNEKAENFIRFGLSEDLGYYVDLEPGTMKAKMQSDLVPASTGSDAFERMAQQALQADQRLENGEITALEHKYIIEQIIEFFESQN